MDENAHRGDGEKESKLAEEQEDHRYCCTADRKLTVSGVRVPLH